MWLSELGWKALGPSVALAIGPAASSSAPAHSELTLSDLASQEPDETLYRPALETLRTLIRTSTSSMTSVPKPLKFLRPHYAELATLQESWPTLPPPTNLLASVTDAVGLTTPATTPYVSIKSLFAEILSVLAMTYSDSGKRETLSYRLKGGSDEDPGLWGHEYVRHLAAELGEEYLARTAIDESTADLLALGLRLVPFLLSHNGEADAVDLLLELESIASIIPHVDDNTYARVCLYMVSCVNLLAPPDDREFLKTARTIYRNHAKYTESITLALKLQDPELIKEDFESPKNPHMKRQLAYILARQQVNVETEDEDLQEILSNTKLSENFKRFGSELSVTEPKSLEDIYKSHMENTRAFLLARLK